VVIRVAGRPISMNLVVDRVDGACYPDRENETELLGESSQSNRNLHGASIENDRFRGPDCRRGPRPQVLFDLELSLSMLCRKCGRKLLAMSEKLEAQMTGGLCRDCVGANRTEVLE
jgi:hypothetical protein